MTADVVQMHPEEKRLEARRIAERRRDAVLQPGVTASKQQAMVERQQVLNVLVAAVGDDRLSITDDQDLPLIVDVLLRNCPQSTTQPAVVAKSVEEAAEAFRVSLVDRRVGDDPRGRDDHAAEAAFICSTLAAGTAQAVTYAYGMAGCQQLADWLSTAGAR